MRRRSAIAILVAVGCTGNDDIHAPRIAAVTPTRATIGTSIVLTGNYFCQQPEVHGDDEVDPLGCEHVGNVQFGASPVGTDSYTDTMIVVEVPDTPAGPIQLRVGVAGRTSNSVELTIE